MYTQIRSNPLQCASKPPREVDRLNAHSIRFESMRIQCGRNQCAFNAHSMRIECVVWTGLYRMVRIHMHIHVRTYMYMRYDYTQYCIMYDNRNKLDRRYIYIYVHLRSCVSLHICGLRVHARTCTCTCTCTYACHVIVPAWPGLLEPVHQAHVVHHSNNVTNHVEVLLRLKGDEWSSK